MKRNQKKKKKNILYIGIFIGIIFLLALLVAFIAFFSKEEKVTVREKKDEKKQKTGKEEEPCLEKKEDILPAVSSQKNESKILAGRFIFPVILLLLLSSFLFFGVARVNGDSMQPTLNDGNYVVYSRWTKNIEIGDIILFERDGIRYVKRIHGLSGDTIEIDDNESIIVNGKPQVIDGLIVMGASEARDMTEQVLVGDLEYFVLGDHRSVSLDSRNSDIGLVKQSEIFGVYLFSLHQ